jgi:predicted small lipoprotein YifL
LAVRFTLIASSLALAGCGSQSPVEHTNATTTDRLNEISQNTTEFDGATQATTPSTPDELGQSMRAGAATRPRQH